MGSFYRSEGEYGLSASGWTTLPDDDAGLVFWFRVVNGQNGRVLLEGSSDLDLMVVNAGAYGFDLEWRGASVAVGLAVGTWHAVAVRNNGGETTLALNGAYIAATETATNQVDGNPTFNGLAGTHLLLDIVYPTYLERELTDAMVAAHYALGHEHAPNVASGDWDPGLDIVIGWWDAPVGASVPSVKSPAHDLVLGDYAFGVPLGGDVATPTIGMVGSTYPPIRTHYTAPGDSGDSHFLVFGDRVSRLFLTDGSTAVWRWWVRRPASPVNDEGALLQILGGDSSITVRVTLGEILTVEASDGTSTETGTASEPLVGMQWTPVTLILDGGELRVYFDALEVAFVDATGLTFVEPEWGMSVIVGNDNTTVAPLDFDFGTIDVFDEALSEDLLGELGDAGREHDVRRPRPVTPPPVVHIIEPVGDLGVVPDAGEHGDTPLIPFGGGESVTEDGEITAWFTGDHQIGIYSSAWFSDAARAPELWSLAHGNDGNAAILGEVPRIVNVTLRSDGALLLDLDARVVPGVGYQLTGPDDITGVDISSGLDLVALYPALLHTSPTVPALLDIDAPVVPAAGFTTVASGDFKLTGELATVEKIIWAGLLTPAGAYEWDPEFGTNLRHKRLRPADLGAERRRIAQQVMRTPHVTRADVQLLFEDDEVVVAVFAETDFGRLETRRAVDAA